MKVLVVNGDCIQVNSSANLCHLAYIRGLVDAGHDVSLLSADGKVYQKDPNMRIPTSVRRYSYYGMSLYERLSLKRRKMRPAETAKATPAEGKANKRKSFLYRFKKWILSLYGVHGIYAPFVRRAGRFHSDVDFDLLLSISTPVTSHLLAHNLLQSGRVKAARWIQIWEDPWYSDAYGFNGKDAIFQEEKRLLGFGQRICYVSPITLENQKKLYPENKEKMFWEPLPAYYAPGSAQGKINGIHFGYFGNYELPARDLRPFYEAANASGVHVTICGNSNVHLESNDLVQVHPRVQLEALRGFEAQTTVLVFLCNRKGGQIPGKIYQYAATDKTVLFILDGTEEEKKILHDFFEPYHRFVFCENNVEDIAAAIERIQRGELGNVVNRPLTDFDPVKIVNRILEEGMK